MLRLSTHVSCGVVLLLLAQFLLPVWAAPSASAQSTGNWLVYHQITNLPEETGSLGYPKLSGDARLPSLARRPARAIPRPQTASSRSVPTAAA
jgi:hypothetical protein